MGPRNFNRHALKTISSALFILLCCSIGAFAQSPSEHKSSGQKDLSKITFNSTPVKAAISAVVSQLGLNVVFDDSVRDDRLTIELNDVTMEQGLKIILVAKKLEARIIEEKTIIVFPDNNTNRHRYEQYELWPAKTDGSK